MNAREGVDRMGGGIGNFMRRLSAGYRRFLYGRYGNDKLNIFISGFALALCLLSIAVHSGWLTTAVLALLLISILRSLSKNYERRRRENRIFEDLSRPAVCAIRYGYARIRYRRTHRVYMCEGCRNTLRIPRSAGQERRGARIEIKCPKCGHAFLKSV